jgi:hypothetical protein
MYDLTEWQAKFWYLIVIAKMEFLSTVWPEEAELKMAMNAVWDIFKPDPSSKTADMPVLHTFGTGNPN